MANRDRGVHCSCDTQGRGGERELGEEGKEVGQEGPVCTVKCCSLSLEQMGERERGNTPSLPVLTLRSHGLML